MEVRKQGLAQQIEERLCDMIAAGNRFSMGDKLPNENDLSLELRVSRATLREAIRSLVVQGVLEVRRGKGTYVVGVRQDASGFKNMERMWIQLRELFEMRLVVEPETTFFAAQRASDRELDEILRRGRADEEFLLSHPIPWPGEETAKTWSELDQAFHESIVFASHNSFFHHLVPLINRSVNEAILMADKKEFQTGFTVQDHALVMEFLKNRDAQGAKHAMAMHILHAIQALDF